MTNMRKAKVENRLMDVVTHEEYNEHPDLYHNSNTAVEFKHDEKTYTLPHRTGPISPDRPGVYNNGPLDYFVLPSKDTESDYTQEVIDFSNNSDIGEIATKMEKVRDLERDILTSPDNIFTPVINETDSPEMKGLKEAVIAKHIDIDKYAERFGDNFPNDKRQFKKGTITLFMLKRMCDALDMKASIIIEDSDPNVPNPIGSPIVIDISGADDDDEDEEV